MSSSQTSTLPAHGRQLTGIFLRDGIGPLDPHDAETFLQSNLRIYDSQGQEVELWYNSRDRTQRCFVNVTRPVAPAVVGNRVPVHQTVHESLADLPRIPQRSILTHHFGPMNGFNVEKQQLEYFSSDGTTFYRTSHHPYCLTNGLLQILFVSNDDAHFEDRVVTFNRNLPSMVVPLPRNRDLRSGLPFNPFPPNARIYRLTAEMQMKPDPLLVESGERPPELSSEELPFASIPEGYTVRYKESK